jgi:hypothetical protein
MMMVGRYCTAIERRICSGINAPGKHEDCQGPMEDDSGVIKCIEAGNYEYIRK